MLIIIIILILFVRIIAVSPKEQFQLYSSQLYSKTVKAESCDQFTAVKR